MTKFAISAAPVELLSSDRVALPASLQIKTELKTNKMIKGPPDRKKNPGKQLAGCLADSLTVSATSYIHPQKLDEHG